MKNKKFSICICVFAFICVMFSCCYDDNQDDLQLKGKSVTLVLKEHGFCADNKIDDSVVPFVIKDENDLSKVCSNEIYFNVRCSYSNSTNKFHLPYCYLKSLERLAPTEQDSEEPEMPNLAGVDLSVFARYDSLGDVNVRIESIVSGISPSSLIVHSWTQTNYTAIWKEGNQSIVYTVEGTLVYKQWVTVDGEYFYRFNTVSITDSGTYNI
ncbi:MAG: hypothetical protein SOW56_07495 [Bacteroidaceae bacterium]|nr:hypothetical protein [Bacteroidaceae bacterium]